MSLDFIPTSKLPRNHFTLVAYSQDHNGDRHKKITIGPFNRKGIHANPKACIPPLPTVIELFLNAARNENPNILIANNIPWIYIEESDDCMNVHSTKLLYTDLEGRSYPVTLKNAS